MRADGEGAEEEDDGKQSRVAAVVVKRSCSTLQIIKKRGND